MVEHGEDYNIELPDIFPLDEIIVDEEQHIYRVFEGSEGPLPEEEYTLDKAPIEEIKKVTGTIDGEEESEFEKGVDYRLSADSERLLWINGDRPDPGTVFYVTYRTESIISRYVESGDEELETIEHIITDAIEGKLISTAEGVELDRIGELFGPVIGKRRGRDDQQYRIYLESVVQSFISRGTIEGIKLAISAATDVPVEDITIEEDFENNEYEVVVIPDTPVDVSLLEEIAEVADPSGIEQALTRFPVSDDMGIEDSVSFSEGQQIDEEITVNDSTEIFRRALFDDAVTDDSVLVNPNKFGPFTDTLFSDDSVLIDPNKNTVSEEMTVGDVGVANRAEASDTLASSDAFAINPRTTATSDSISTDDTVTAVETVGKNSHRWEETNDPDVTTEWNFFEWTEIVDFNTAVSDTAFIDDAATVPPKDGVTTDTLYSDDTVDVEPNVTTVTNTAFADDTVTIPAADATTVDSGGSSDSVTNVSQTLVAWDTQDWETLQWTKEHN